MMIFAVKVVVMIFMDLVLMKYLPIVLVLRKTDNLFMCIKKKFLGGHGQVSPQYGV